MPGPWSVQSRRLVALLTAVAISASGLVAGCSSDESITPPSASTTDDAGRTAQAQDAVRDLQAALLDQDRAAAESLGVGGARAVLGAAADNAKTLGISDLGMRFVEDNAIGPDDLGAYGPDAWRGTVEVEYRIPGDPRSTRVETPVIFVPDGDSQRIAAVGGADGRTPLWLRGPVEVRRGDRSLVILRAGSAARYDALAKRALAAVGKVLPDWKGDLVLEVPATEQELDEALGATQEQYANIAAVTASVDGSLAPGSPVHVFINPRVFDGLGPRGAQVVASHESTHVAADATFSDMPTWLLEGFADYVALAHAGVPVRTAASQILSRIRRQGAPDHLPTTEELDPTAPGLGATYELAWLATRFIARTYGEDRLVAFYRAVDSGTPVGTAFREVLGTTEDGFVDRWRDDLVALAGGEAG